MHLSPGYEPWIFIYRQDVGPDRARRKGMAKHPLEAQRLLEQQRLRPLHGDARSEAERLESSVMI